MMMKRNKWFVFASVVASLAMVFASCDNGSTDNGNGTENGGENGETPDFANNGTFTGTATGHLHAPDTPFTVQIVVAGGALTSATVPVSDSAGYPPNMPGEGGTNMSRFVGRFEDRLESGNLDLVAWLTNGEGEFDSVAGATRTKWGLAVAAQDAFVRGGRTGWPRVAQSRVTVSGATGNAEFLTVNVVRAENGSVSDFWVSHRTGGGGNVVAANFLNAEGTNEAVVAAGTTFRGTIVGTSTAALEVAGLQTTWDAGAVTAGTADVPNATFTAPVLAAFVAAFNAAAGRN
jgi:hypothetical protein